MPETVKLELTIDDINAILQTLGQLPTSSGAWPLMMKVRQQAEAQLPQQPAPAPTAEPAEDKE